MYHIFYGRSHIDYQLVKPPEWMYLTRIYHSTLKNLIEYYHRTVYTVPTEHMLSRLLMHSLPPVEYPVDRFTETARARAPFITRTFQITSETNKGSLFKNIFVGNNNPEIIINRDTYFNPYLAEKNWQQIRAVKFILHPFTNLMCLLPLGYGHNEENGISVITINLPLLLVQYRGFLLNQLQTNRRLSASHFIHMYVLPNMLYQQLDLCVINRLMASFYNNKMTTPAYKHRIPILNYSGKVDKTLNQVKKTLESRIMKYENSFQMIPVFSQVDSQAVLELPDIPLTRQVNWAVAFSRIPYINFIMDISQKSIGLNRSEINMLKFYWQRINNEHILPLVLPEPYLTNTTDWVNKLIKI